MSIPNTGKSSIYERDSADRPEGRRHSIEQQREQCRRWAKENGHQIGDEFIEEPSSPNAQ